MQELEKRIGLLRLLIADIEAKQSQLLEMENQYRGQLAKIVEFVVYRDGDVSNALSLMSEVQSKLNEVVQTVEHLNQIHGKSMLELEALTLTKRVAEARSQLAELEQRQKELSDKLAPISGMNGGHDGVSGEEQMESLRSISDEVAEVAEEISRLQTLITEASERAANTIHRRQSNSV